MTSGGLAAVSSSAFAALYSAFGKYDVVHIHAEGPAFFAWLPKMFGKRVVVTVHGIDSLHNSFYFVEAKNIIHDRPMVAKNFENLVNELLRSNSPKKWFRAYFNHGLINYIYGQKRLLPCDMSFDTFFIDPYGDVMPCNGTKDKEVMGNLNNQTWDELWNSPEAEKVRAKVRCCDRDCWMIGSVSPAMHKYIWKPATWVLVHKFKALFTKHPYSMYELKICRDYRDGKVTKEELDKCSTCDMNCVINNGLSEAY